MPEKLICPITHIAPLLPHSGHMVLLDCITEYGDDYLHATAHVGEKHILLQAGSLPVLAGMEIMAQGIAALAGCHAHNRGEPVRLGFLLGTRKLNLFADTIAVGTHPRKTARASACLTARCVGRMRRLRRGRSCLQTACWCRRP